MRHQPKHRKETTHTISGAMFIASASISLAKIGTELTQIDPNKWYTVFMMYIDQIASQAELLQEFWTQHQEELRGMGFVVPARFTAVHHSVDAPLMDVFKELAKQYSEDTEREGDAPILPDLPF